MNNQQFRKLVLDTPARQPSSGSSAQGAGATPRRDGATPTLGSRMRSSIPMTPRAVGSIDFKRQLAEKAAEGQPQPQKKFRSAAAPKGAKLAAGYVDRTQSRVSDEDDEKASRIKALEELLKLDQIDRETFEKLRDEITGGKLDSTHLVKGLDFKLLERVRRGEVTLDGEAEPTEDDIEQDEDDIEAELEQLEVREMAPALKLKATKKGEMAPPSLVPGKKRNRDQILAELKASRQAAAEAAKPSLGSKFKKVGAPRSTSRIERDGKGREVLITVDENGNEKRKVRRVQIEQKVEKGMGLLMPDKDAKPLGMVVPELPKSPEEKEDFDIFDDVGDDYDPLAGLDENDSIEEEAKKDAEGPLQDAGDLIPEDSSMTPLPRPHKPAPNYFNDTTKEETEQSAGARAMADPTILAALKKASTLKLPSDKSLSELAEEKAKEEKRRKMLQLEDRDAQDMDLGFGSSFAEDNEDGEDRIVKLSEWGANDEEEDGVKGRGRGKKSDGEKSKKGKKKGDVNSVADVMRVIEGRKGVKPQNSG